MLKRRRRFLLLIKATVGTKTTRPTSAKTGKHSPRFIPKSLIPLLKRGDKEAASHTYLFTISLISLCFSDSLNNTNLFPMTWTISAPVLPAISSQISRESAPAFLRTVAFTSSLASNASLNCLIKLSPMPPYLPGISVPRYSQGFRQFLCFPVAKIPFLSI